MVAQLAAQDTILRLLAPGDRILLGADAYGGTFRLIDKVYGYGPAGYHTPTSTSPTSPRWSGTGRPMPGWSGSRHPPTHC